MSSKKPTLLGISSCLIAAILISVLVSACATTNHSPLKTVDSLKKDEFEGKWYVIANIPYFAEKNKVATSSTYVKRGPNDYEDIYTYQNRNFESKVKTKRGSIKSVSENNAQWLSTFYWVIKFKFDVLYVNDENSIMLLGHPSRNYGWLMAKKNTIDDLDYAAAMNVFANNGYDILKFAKVPQLAEQVGLPGFQEIE